MDKGWDLTLITPDCRTPPALLCVFHRSLNLSETQFPHLEMNSKDTSMLLFMPGSFSFVAFFLIPSLMSGGGLLHRDKV